MWKVRLVHSLTQLWRFIRELRLNKEMKFNLIPGPCSVFHVICQKKYVTRTNRVSFYSPWREIQGKRTTEHGPCVLCGFSQNSPTKQLLRKKNLKKNLYRTRILGELGIMRNTNGYLLPVVPVVPVQKLSNWFIYLF